MAAPRRHATAIEHARLALLAVALEPDVDRLPLHPDRLGGRGLGHAGLLDQVERAAAPFLLRRPADAAKIPCVHRRDIGSARPDVRYSLGGLLLRRLN